MNFGYYSVMWLKSLFMLCSVSSAVSATVHNSTHLPRMLPVPSSVSAAAPVTTSLVDVSRFDIHCVLRKCADFETI